MIKVLDILSKVLN